MPREVERQEHGVRTDPLSDQGLNIQTRAGRGADPGPLAIANAFCGSHLRIDFGEHFLLQLGQPGVGPGFLAAAFEFDQASRGHDQREFLVHLVGNVFLLNGFVQRGQAPECFLVVVGRVFGDQIGTNAVQRLAVLRNGIREIPDHGARLGVAKGMATVVFHDHADEATGRVGLPVFAFGRGFFGIGQLIPPAELFHQQVVKLGVARGDVSAQRVGTVFSQQVLAFPLNAEVGAEITAAVHDVLGGVVQIGGAGMLHLRCTVARPGQAEVVARGVVAGFLVLAAFGLERLDVKHVHVAHVRLQALRALAGVANGPDTFVDFTQDVLGHGFVHALDFLHLVIFGELFAKAQFFSELMHDHLVAAAFPQRLNDFFAPLQRAVGGRHGAAGFKLGRRRQQVHRAVGVEVFSLARHGGHGGCGRRIGVDHHQQVQLVHGALHLQTTGL